ncbi:MAG TPA: OprD family outer membrane porin [Candidatus Eisenbacteria bacterium]|nr:OprD family outer membrane porin [Candidatus Eisenbacteria bacterium]
MAGLGAGVTALALAFTLVPEAPQAMTVTDTTLVFHLRSFYYDGTQNTGGQNEAWTGGGWLAYRSGWLSNAFAAGATLYGSAPLYAPEDKDGTFLLKPGQEGYLVLGEAYAALRYRDDAVFKLYRQQVDQGYINPSDIRMTPNTFEGATVGGVIRDVRYLAGYLWRVKQWNADEFVSMAEKAGAGESDAGVGLIGVQLAPLQALRFDVHEQYGFDTFNTLYVKGDYRRALSAAWTVAMGAEFTDQRAVGDALVINAASRMWRTRVGGGRVQLIHRDLTLTTAFSVTASGNDIQNPWGTYPGYLSLFDAPASQGFARANEEGWLVGAVYDFSRLGASGLVGAVNFARGTDAIDPESRASAPDQTEYNFKIDYLVPWRPWGSSRDLRLTVREAFYDREGFDLAHQLHVILNWEWDVLNRGR